MARDRQLADTGTVEKFIGTAGCNLNFVKLNAPSGETELVSSSDLIRGLGLRLNHPRVMDVKSTFSRLATAAEIRGLLVDPNFPLPEPGQPYSVPSNVSRAVREVLSTQKRTVNVDYEAFTQ